MSRVDTKSAEHGAKLVPAAKAPDSPSKPGFTAEPAPNRFTAEAKDAWASAPETLRSEVLRLERELRAGIEKYRAAAARDEATILELRNEIAELKREKQETDYTTEIVMKFAADHPRLEELSEDIVFFLDSGRAEDLAEAYELAERLNPAARPN
ncbi:hypothetical protein QA640_22795 [Bradyrhizobium sp. CB82]|uniref:hypothetical protein n=1 Tax=Bradyrhizobium sp. CB82 TaxID=3039159 RepID=UPI0024B22A80|nr:hypothetical protein [Bradyrhizobium sp. CB82]WFU37323.1 hypothetical protein QA640_22795 [Bradyrhizobium sp. CB82]